MKDIKLHQNGPCTVSYGSMYGFDGCMIEQPAVILDMSDKDDSNSILTLLKYGSHERIKPLFEHMRTKYKSAGFDEIADNLTLISFNTVTGFADYDKMTNAKFTTDEICTLINWMQNVIPVKSFIELIESDETTIHERLAQLASFGF